jgi:hypothetical protein
MHIPIRPVLAATAAMVLVVAIGFGIAQLANEPTAGVGTGAQVIDVPMDGFGRIPEQRLHPVDVSGTADVPMDGFGRIPEQRLHPVDVGGADISLPEPPSLVWARAGGPRPLEP